MIVRSATLPLLAIFHRWCWIFSVRCWMILRKYLKYNKKSCYKSLKSKNLRSILKLSPWKTCQILRSTRINGFRNSMPIWNRNLKMVLSPSKNTWTNSTNYSIFFKWSRKKFWLRWTKKTKRILRMSINSRKKLKITTKRKNSLYRQCLHGFRYLSSKSTWRILSNKWPWSTDKQAKASKTWSPKKLKEPPKPWSKSFSW